MEVEKDFKKTEKFGTEDIYDNYDAVFKDAVTIFKDKALDFFGLTEDAVITDLLRTENKEIQAKIEFSDLTFRLSNGKGLHLEEEVDLSKKDLLRFCGYHVDLMQTYDCEFITVIFVKNAPKHIKIDTGMLKFIPKVVDCNDFNADEILIKLKEQVKNNEPLNELEVIYLALFKSEKYVPAELLREAANIIKNSKMSQDKQIQIISLAIVVSNKVVDKLVLDRIWEDIKAMNLKILEVAEEKGIEKGMEKRTEEIALKLLEAGQDFEFIVKITGITAEKLLELIKVKNLKKSK